MALCSTKEDCSLAAFTDGSTCEMASSASVASHHGQGLRAYWDSGAQEALGYRPIEVCTWSEYSDLILDLNENEFHQVGQVEDREECKEVQANVPIKLFSYVCTVLVLTPRHVGQKVDLWSKRLFT